MNKKQNQKKRKSLTEIADERLSSLFPEFDNDAPTIWRRQKNQGFATIPRTLPIAMQIANQLVKGNPAGHTLFGLWARAPDSPLVTIESQEIFAVEAGFTGQRLVHTWRQKMKLLSKYQFIAVKKGDYGDYNYVLLLNPNAAIYSLYKQNCVNESTYQRFVSRISDIGASNELDQIKTFYDKSLKGGENG